MAALLIFDLSNQESFLKLPDYINDFTEACPSSWIYLIGNKLDLERKVSREEAKNFAKQSNLKYFEVSAVTDQNIDSLLHHIALDSFESPQPILKNDSQSENQNTKTKCNIS